MGWGIKKFGRSLVKGARAVSKSPLTKLARGVPVLGSAIAAADLALTVADIGGAFDSKSSAPMLPAPSGSRLPALPNRLTKVSPSAMNRYSSQSSSVPAVGTMQLPMNVPGAMGLPPMLSLDQGRTYYRAPRGYVTVEWQGKKFFMLKANAKQAKLWTPNKKPPISVTNWEHLKGANRTVKKLKSINKMAENVANFKTRSISRKKCA